MLTPWGRSDSAREIAPGVYEVSTPTHGGYLVGRAVAEERLSDHARAIGEPWGSWLAFEEDCDWAAVAVEIPETYDQERYRMTLPEDLRDAIESAREYAGGYVDVREEGGERVWFAEFEDVPGGSDPFTTDDHTPEAYALHEALAHHGIAHEMSDEGTYEYPGSENRWRPDDKGGRWLQERIQLAMGGLAYPHDPADDQLTDAELGAKVRAYFAD